MEEIGSYIESGILELYAAGDLTPPEKLEVEAMLLKHPTLRSELADIEKSLEKYARAYSLTPPSELRSKILGALSSEHVRVGHTAPGEPAGLPAKVENSFFKYAFAACALVLLMSLVTVAILYSNLQESQQQLTALQNSNQQFSGKLNYMEDQLSEREVALSVLRNPEYKLIKLAGTKQAPRASMMLAFHPEKKEVMLDMAAINMPANDSDHQYQLWAMVDGTPVDLGVFDMRAEDKGMKKMKSIDQAQAFAVTLERRGGSKSPTMEQMMVRGAI